MSISNIQSMISTHTTITTATNGTQGEPGQIYVGLASGSPALPKFVSISNFTMRDMGILIDNISDSSLNETYNIFDIHTTLRADALASAGVFASKDEALRFFALASEIFAFFPEQGEFGNIFTLDTFNQGQNDEEVGLRYLNGVIYWSPTKTRTISPLGRKKK